MISPRSEVYVIACSCPDVRSGAECYALKQDAITQGLTSDEWQREQDVLDDGNVCGCHCHEDDETDAG
jgi:hypothetical protein